MKTILGLIAMSLFFPLAAQFLLQDPEPESGRQEPIPVPQEGAVERRDFMRTKLLYLQNIFEGLTIGEFDLINRGIQELEQIMHAEQWVTIDNDDYRRLMDEFQRAVERVKRSAESKNIEATSFRFYEMSTRCIDCHQHLLKSGYHY